MIGYWLQLIDQERSINKRRWVIKEFPTLHTLTAGFKMLLRHAHELVFIKNTDGQKY